MYDDKYLDDIGNDGEDLLIKAYTDDPVEVSEINLDQTSVQLYTGENVQLAATVLPANAGKFLSWSSSDGTVATVDSTGKVKAVKAGTATITATARNGVSASCTVSVKQKATGITLSKTSIELYTGSTETLTATVSPPDTSDKSLTWSSSNTAVATVDTTGKVTAIKAGTATITATATDGSGIKATCTVTVKQKVTGITLSKTSTELYTGSTETLTATVSPSDAGNKAVSWSSSNANVAKVDNTGKVTAVKAGTATITAAATDGSGIKATCAVTVKQKVTGITLSKTEAELYLGKTGSLTLSVSVSPSDASEKSLTWSSSDPTVATVDNTGKVTAVKVGTATITATAKDGSGKSATCTVNVYQPMTGITLSSHELSLYLGDKNIRLSATSQPANANNKAVVWSSSNKSVLTVDAGGKLTPIKAGTAVITVMSKDDSTISDSCTVTVTDTKTGTSGLIEWSVGANGTLSYTGDLASEGEGSLSAIVAATQDYASSVNEICIKIPNITDLTGIFGHFPNLREIDLSSCEGENIVSADGAMNACTKLVKVTLPANMNVSIDLPQIKGKEWKCENNGQICQNTLANYDQTAVYILVEKPNEPSSGNDKKPSVPEKKKVSAISLNGLSNKVAAGKKLQLAAEVSPSDAANKGVVWSVDNSKYATVSAQGVVTAKKDGAGKSVTVKATAADGSGVTATYKITIMKDAVTSVKITSKTKTVNVGKSIKLKANIKTSGKKVNKGLKWTSSNTDYATVNKSGKVTTKKAGKGKTVTITAQATDGSNKKAKIKIKIK